MKKGITPVIAVILLLAITISMIGFTFVWFSRVAEFSTNSTTRQLENQQRQFNLKLQIIDIVSEPAQVPETGLDYLAQIRNTGTETILPGDIYLQVKDQDGNLLKDGSGVDLSYSCNGPECTLAPNEVASFLLFNDDRALVFCNSDFTSLSVLADLPNANDDVGTYTCPAA